MKRKVNYKAKKVTRRMFKEYQNALKNACPQWTRAKIRAKAKQQFFWRKIARQEKVENLKLYLRLIK